MAKVMVVDDELTMVQMVTESLRAEGHEVMPFTNELGRFRRGRPLRFVFLQSRGRKCTVSQQRGLEIRRCCGLQRRAMHEPNVSWRGDGRCEWRRLSGYSDHIAVGSERASVERWQRSFLGCHRSCGAGPKQGGRPYDCGCGRGWRRRSRCIRGELWRELDPQKRGRYFGAQGRRQTSRKWPPCRPAENNQWPICGVGPTGRAVSQRRERSFFRGAVE